MQDRVRRSEHTHTAAAFADQWVPIRPGTDAAMAIAMAYVMITEDLQDQTFLHTYTVGFDKFKDYVMGKDDGVPKTPGWAEAITGVAAETIAQLATDYATIRPGALMAERPWLHGLWGTVPSGSNHPSGHDRQYRYPWR